MKQLSRIALCLPLLLLNIEHTPDTNVYEQLNEPSSLISVGWGWRLTLNTADASQQCESPWGGDMVTCGQQPPGWDPIWPDPWDDPCRYGCNDNSDGGGGGSGPTQPSEPTPPNDYRPVSYERCLLDADIDKNHCVYLANSVAALSAPLCFGFILPITQAACGAVVYVGRELALRDCNNYYSHHTYECSTMFPQGSGSWGGGCGSYGCTAIP